MEFLHFGPFLGHRISHEVPYFFWNFWLVSDFWGGSHIFQHLFRHPLHKHNIVEVCASLDFLRLFRFASLLQATTSLVFGRRKNLPATGRFAGRSWGSVTGLDVDRYLCTGQMSKQTLQLTTQQVWNGTICHGYILNQPATDGFRFV